MSRRLSGKWDYASLCEQVWKSWDEYNSNTHALSHLERHQEHPSGRFALHFSSALHNAEKDWYLTTWSIKVIIAVGYKWSHFCQSAVFYVPEVIGTFVCVFLEFVFCRTKIRKCYGLSRWKKACYKCHRPVDFAMVVSQAICILCRPLSPTLMIWKLSIEYSVGFALAATEHRVFRCNAWRFHIFAVEWRDCT